MKKKLFLLIFKIYYLTGCAQSVRNDSISNVVNRLSNGIWQESSHFLETNGQIDSSKNLTCPLYKAKYIDWKKKDDNTWVCTRFLFKEGDENTIIVPAHGHDNLRVKFFNKKILMNSIYVETYEYSDEILYIDEHNLRIRQINPDQIEVISFIKQDK